MNGRPMHVVSRATEERARQSRGASEDPIHAMVVSALRARGALTGTGTLVDVGCGTGALWRRLSAGFARYVGVDAVHYDDFPADADLHLHDFDAGPLPVASATGDVVAAVETIEHLENPWAFVRELARVARPGGWVIVTTPNQLSVLSKTTLLMRGQFNAFQDASYPAHRTALVAQDLERAAVAAGLTDVAIAHSASGRVPGTGRHFPHVLSTIFPRAFSDNVLLAARRPGLVAGVP